ncbi:MAG: phenylalanine--tRNA ligase subunit alpha [Archaeoglobus sp.]|jgi:phenylalanyl-tRNA synthetase alpha chain|nr:MAG: phenylalanine--tRNA ligase subunit alpha [Archaeoglobus sp.]
MLSPIEVTLIKELGKGKYSVDEAAKKAGIKRDTVLKASYLLQEKGYAEVITEVTRRYFLTDEGKMYLDRGLPEEKLVKLLEDTNDIKELQQKMGKVEFGIALGWLRKKGAVEIRDGKIKLVKKPEFKEKEWLRAIAEGKKIGENELKTLLKRKLIDFDEDKEIYVLIKDVPEVEICEYISDLTPELIKSGKWKNKKFLKYDIGVPAKDIFASKLHPYERIIRECRRIFLEMGFTEIKGNYIQPAFWNFDALFQPQDHPARDMQDTFYLEKYVGLNKELEDSYVERVRETHENGWITGSTGWGGKWDFNKARQLVLRTHTTAITIHYLALNPEPPVKAFCIDRVYRRETIDSTHLPEFDQLEGVVLDRGVGFKHLLGMLREFFIKMGFEDVRFRPGYFPYTEPSVEPEVYVEELGWIELGGAGIFRKEVTEPLGIKGKVLAWGLGIGRLAMLRLGMKDLRKLYQPDLGWLRDCPVVRR